MSLGARIPAMAVAAFLMLPGSWSGAEPIAHPHVQDEIIIKFAPTATQAEKNAILGDLGATKLKDLKRMNAASHRLHGLTVEQAVQRYKNSPKIEYIEPNYIRQVEEIPNDPQFSGLWGLLNTGQTGGRPDADIDAEMAWDVFTGSENVVVGIIDTGADFNHPDLAANIYTNPGETPGNGIDDDGNGYIDDVRGWDFANNDNSPMDDNGHGTHTAGTVGAVGDNGIGVVGVNWRVRIMPLKAFNAGGGATDVDLIEAIQYSTMMGVRLTSNSWGGGPFSAAMFQAISAANAAGILFVAAAGNSGSDNDAFPHYPSGYDLPNVVSVAATDHNDALAGFSSYGATTVDLGAPGVDILSTLPGNSYGHFSGTSMATPHVSGVLALICGRFPGIGAPQAKALLLIRTDPVPGLAGRVLSGGRLNAFGAIAEPDSTPPGPVSDLAVGQAGSNWLVLHWSATGDDGTSGTASRYELRYATFPITAANFDTATPASGEPDPGPPGTAEEMQVRGLAFNTPYSFAVKVLDEFGNPSEISNIVSGTTLGPPEIDVQPTALAEALLTGASSTQRLTLHNLGEGTLDFVIPNPALVTSPVAIQQSLVLGKDEVDPRAGAPILAGSGGPDGFGYRWVDSDEPGGPGFAWADISATGSVALSSGDDVAAGPFPIGFSFPFYGGEFTEFFVTSNGIISLSEADASYGNQPLPTPGAPAHLIAAFWDDLILSPGTVYWRNDGSHLIVQWQSVQHYGSGGPYTFQAILSPNGGILYQYLSMGEPRTSATIGIQNGNGSDGLQVVFNAPYVHDNLAVRIASVPQWVTVVPASGTVVAPGSTVLDVTIDAASLLGGAYEAEIHVLSNDADEPDLRIPVQLQVTGAPDIAVSASALDFGSPFVGGQVLRDLVVSNPGTDVLHVTSVAADHADFSTDVSSFDLAPFGARTLHVRFAPSSAAVIQGTLTLTSNDPDEGQVSVALQGEGLLPPDIAVSPASLSADLLSGQTATRTLTIANQGVSNLDFQLAFEFLSATAGATSVPKTPVGPARLAGSGLGDQEPRLASELVRQEKRQGPPPTNRNFAGSLPPATAAELRTYGVAAENILVYADDYRHSAGSHYVDQALQALGLSYTAYYNDPGGFELALASGSWDLVIVDNYSFGLGPVWDDIDAHIAAGGKALITTWNLDAVSGEPLWAHLGLQVVSDLFSAMPVFRWDPGHSLFTRPESVPDFTELSDFYTDDGDRVNAVGSSQLVAGFTPTATAGQGALLFTAARNAIVNTFMPVESTSDRDADGKLDAVELFTNEISALSVPAWLSANVEAGTVPPGGSVDIQITFDATDLFGGDYDARITVTSNDPDESPVQVPAHLHVTGVEDIDVQPLALDFGNVFLGYSAQRTLTVTNAGTDVLTVSGTFVGLTDYHLSASSYVLQPHASTTITVTFTPTLATVRNTQLAFASSDPDESLVLVTLAGTGLVPPVATLLPTSLSANLLSGASETQFVTLSNTGGSDLEFSASPETHVSSVENAHLELAKGEPDPRVGAPVLQNNGGPDGFGYRWIDSDDPAGPGFQWIDVSSTGTPVFSSPVDDSNMGPFPIGFAFSYYGNTYTDFRVCSNGFISFTSSSAQYSNQPLPNLFAPENMLAAFWSDLAVIPADGNVYWHSDDTRLVVQYEHVRHLGGDGPYSFEIVLYPNGSIVYQYLSVGDGYPNITVGFQNAAGNDGLTIAFNTSYVHDNLAVRIAALPPWLNVSPATGVVPAGGSVQLAATFDATGLLGGGYEGNLLVRSNDPAHHESRVPVHLQVTGVPDIALGASALDFGSTFLGTQVTRDLVVSNPGTDVLHVTGAAVNHGDFSVAISSFDLAPFGSRTLQLTFAPSNAGVIQATLTLASNDPDEGQLSVALQGQGLLPPDIAVSPPSLSADLLTGQTATRTLTIANQGASTLEYQIGFEYLSAPSATTAAAGKTRGAPATVAPLPIARGEMSAVPVLPRLQAEPNAPGGTAPPAEFRTYGLAAERILLYADDYRHSGGSHYMDQALQGLGLSYTAYYNDPAGFEIALASGSWDLVIVDNYNFILGPVWDDIDAHLAAGGKVLITTWNLDGVSAEPLWAHLGLQWVGDFFTPLPVYRWDPGHPLFTRPESVPDFTQLTDFYNDDGDRVNALGSSQTVAGFTPAATLGEGALLVSAAHNAIVNTFMPVENDRDRDSDGKLDAIELFTNEITALTIPAWLSSGVESGSVPPGGSVQVQITFDAAELLGGDYEAHIVVTNNDPDESEVRVPAHLHVTGVEDITVGPLALDFGSVFLGFDAQRTLTVTNAGTDVLTVTGTMLGLPDYSASPTAYVLQPHASATVTVTFAPTVGTVRNTQLALASSDPDEPIVVVELTGTGVVPPQLSVTPATLTAAAAPGGQKTKTLRICNNGGSDLVFGTSVQVSLSSPASTVALPGLDAAGAMKLASPRATRLALGAPASAVLAAPPFVAVTASTFVPVEHVELAKGEPDPRRGAPVLQNSGGPDVFGYRWIDSDDPAGPAFQWIDVSRTGTPVFLSPVDDSNRGPFPIGFGFSYYGITYTQFRICSNGFISFTSPSAQFSNQPLPSTNAPENMLAAFWSDLAVNPTEGNVYWHSDGTRLVVQYEHVRHLSGEGPFSFEIVLTPDGNILYQYLTMLDGYPFNTVGFQNDTRDDGLTIAFNTSYVHDNLAVRIAVVPPWFSLSPDHGVVPAGQCMDLTVTLDAAELEAGDHSGTIVVSGNDPYHPSLSVPVLFHVGEIEAVVADIDPNAINPQSNGNWVTAHVELPPGYAPGDVVIETVTLNGTVPADTENYETHSDFNNNGIPDCTFKFPRAAVEAILPEGEAVLLRVAGEVQDTNWFWGSELVRIIRPRLHAPNGGETLAAGSSFTVTWENPRDWHVSQADLYFSLDDGASWSVLAVGVTGTSCTWSVPTTATQNARVRVFVYDTEGVLGYDTSDGTFSIGAGPTDMAGQEIPKVYALRQNVPNPFNPMTRIEFDLPVEAQVRLVVYDAKGRLVTQLLDQWMPAGRQQAVWRGTDARGRLVPSGVYICEIQAGTFTGRKRMVMVK